MRHVERVAGQRPRLDSPSVSERKMPLADQISSIDFRSIAGAGTGLRELDLPMARLGPSVGEALALSRTRALRMTRGLIETASDTDQAAQEMGTLVEWAAREGTAERQVVADALRISGAEVLLVDRVARLPRSEARPFVRDWLEAGGDRKAVAEWLAVVGRVLRENPGARPRPGDSGGVVDWIAEAAEDVVDAITEAVETVVDAVIEAGQALADVLEEVVTWTIDQVGNLMEALLDAGRTVGQLIQDAVDAGVTLFKKVVKALIEIGRTVGEVLVEVVTQAAGVVADAIRALREIAVSFADILRDAVALVGDGLRQVVAALRDIGRSVVQIMSAALEAAASVLRSTIQALIDIVGSVATLITDVVTGRRSLIDAFTQAMRDIGRTVGQLLDDAADAVAGAVRSIARSLADIGETIVDLAEWAADAAIGFSREVVAALVEVGKTAVNLITSVAQGALDVMRTMVDGLYALGRTFGQLLRDLAAVAADVLEAFLRAAWELGATIVEFVAETARSTYAAARRMVEAAIRAGAAVADLLAEAVKGTYFALRRMIFGMADLVGVGEIMRWAVDRLESLAENVFHEVMTALRYAGQALTDVLDWAAEQGQAAFDAVVDAWESVREDLIDLYRWASNLAAEVAEEVWERIGRATQRFQNSVTYVLNYLENDFLPGVRRFVNGLLDAGYELVDLMGRLLSRAVAFVAEAVRELLALGVTLADLLAATLEEPASAWDNLVAALREVGATWAEIMAAAETAGEDALAELVETARRLEEPLEQMLAGALEVQGGYLGLLVSQLFNSLGTYRPLTDAEKAAAAPVFGDSLDLDRISISHESLDNDVIFAIQNFFAGNTNSRAFVTGTLINMDVNQPIDTPTLIHELTHVWQNFATGPMYLSEAIHAQITDPDAYNYGYTDAATGLGGEAALIAAGGDFEAFNREQQGQIVMHYYVRRYAPPPLANPTDPPLSWAEWQPYIDVVQAA